MSLPHGSDVKLVQSGVQEPDKHDMKSSDMQSKCNSDLFEEKGYCGATPVPEYDTGAAELCRVHVSPSHSSDQPSFTRKEDQEEANVGHEKAQEQSDWVSRVEFAAGNGIKEVNTNNLATLDSAPNNGVINETGISGERHSVMLSNTESLEKTAKKKLAGLDTSPEKEFVFRGDGETGFLKLELDAQAGVDIKTPAKTYVVDINALAGGNESGTEEEQAAFVKELETFYKERRLEFKPPRFYGGPLNCLKLWRAVIRLGGYEQVTACKLWRQIGESFKPPKTCTTVSWTFRGFYEKTLLEYEKHKMRCGELPFADTSLADPSEIGNQTGLSQASVSGRARRDAAARAMQGWHSQRLLDNGEVGDPTIKDKSSISVPKREKQIRSVGLLKRKKLSPVDHTLQAARMKMSKPHVETVIVDIGHPADWVKINVQRTKDCFEVYALVPGLLREEVRVQSDPAGRVVISGQPDQLDNHWGVTPFKKVVSLPSRIDPHQTSAVVTLHGQLFVRVPFEQSDM